MHELSRHTIHETETLEVTARTLAIISKQHGRCRHVGSVDSDVGSCVTDIDFHQQFLENLRLRAAAFVQRLQNEIRLVSLLHVMNTRRQTILPIMRVYGLLR